MESPHIQHGNKTAAIYCRVSTEDQQREGSSLDSQKSQCLLKAHETGYSVPDNLVFSEVFSGADTDRPKLNEMRKLVRNHQVDAVICYSTDRLARNPIHIAIIAEECEKKEIELIFVSEPLDKTPEGALIRYVKGYAAQIEREKIRERSLRGKREKSLQGKFATSGPRLYGYDVVDKRRVINESEAEVIRRIFNWFAEDGYTIFRATRQLNKEGVPGPGGGRWNEGTVYRFLTHPAFQGVTYAFRYQTINGKRQKSGKPARIRGIRDRSEWIEVPGATPAIVSKETWEAAQRQLEINRHKSPSTRKTDYLFINSRLRCGTCGRTMTGGVRVKKGRRYPYYRCICYLKPHYYKKCSQPTISGRIIENTVWEHILSILNNPDALLANIENHSAEEPSIIETEIFLIENNIRSAQEEEKRYIQLYGKGRISEATFEEFIEKVRQTLSEHQNRLKELREKKDSVERVIANKDKLMITARAFAETLQDADYELKVKALEALDIRVTFTPDKQIVIDGLIPVGVTDLRQSSRSSWSTSV